ncbi:hypothetical protein ACFVTY_05505 [Streptomyces sp. NPDC058067]|uniref:hypothetical protein n=1 Tax=Streptomyces sp. NPDC058067 TaxID=3346324 RepID=UPI0036E1B204
MGSLSQDCECARPTHCPRPYTIRFRDGLGKWREEAGYGTQDDAIERLTQIYAENKKAAPSVAEARLRGNQVNTFRTFKAILRDASGKGAMVDDPVKGVQEPEYADEDVALAIVMTVGSGLRKGEARAVNVNNVVAHGVYRVREQNHHSTDKPAKLKHRKAGRSGSGIDLGHGRPTNTGVTVRGGAGCSQPSAGPSPVYCDKLS